MATEDEIRQLAHRFLDEALAPGTSPGTGNGTKAERVAMGADHGGFQLKDLLVAYVRELGYTVDDCGTHSKDSVDYPDLAHAVAAHVSDGRCRWGIVVDGAGIGSAMVANKVPGVRAALCYDISTARNSREHNHANVLTLGAGLIGVGLAKQIVKTWFETPWGPGRHADRIDKLRQIEERYLKREQRDQRSSAR